MKLKFKILWFEDDPEIVNDDIGPEIKRYLEEQGFDYETIHKLNGDNLESLIKDRTIDLIVTDLNLGEHETGEKLIDHIRQDNILTEVLLYSANVTEINSLIENKGIVERVSFAVGIPNLPEKFKRIISLCIKKVQDVNNMRGLVIAETIDLEKKIEMIMIKYFDATGGVEVDKKKKVVLKHIYDKKVEKHTFDLKEIKGISFNDLHTLIEKDILTASNSFEAIQSILKSKIKEFNVKLSSRTTLEEEKQSIKIQKEELEGLKNELDNFRQEILNIRNTLAHVEEQLGSDGIPYLKSINKNGSAISFTPEKYIEIRKDLKKHAKNLTTILQHI